MIINVSPADYNADETYQALQYGQRVKRITNNGTKNTEAQETTKLKEMVRKLQEEVDGLRK